MDTTSIIVIAAILVVAAFFLRKITTMNCPRCGTSMRLLTVNVGHTKKYECKKCKKRVDTKVPAGKGKR